MSKRFDWYRQFTKHYRQRIRPNPRLKQQFTRRLELWRGGIRGAPLFDHQLTGEFKRFRAFSITGDIRVIYEETNEAIVLMDIGTHAQVYDE